MSQVITNAFEQYWQSSLAAEQPVVLDEFILADIPNLDITSPIDPATGLPPESQIVHRQNVDQRGRINNNAVAYTIVMDTTVGDFSFNAMYLRNKANGVIGMIVYKGRETKLKTDQTTGQTGNSLVKSMLMGYDQAAEATLTHVDAGTWQIDYAARLRGMDEDIRQLQADLYGHHTFVGDGFKVVEKDGSYQVSKGVAIIGGLRVELKAPEVIHPGTKPIGVWVDVHRAGSLLSEHQNHFTIITSVADLTDHVDSNGYQHYVAKLAAVQADGTIVDGRGSAGSGSGAAGSIPDTFALWKRSMAEAGYDLIGQFGIENTIETAKQVLLSKDGTEVYAWLGELPKSVKRNSTPENAGGIGDDAWKQVTWGSLRSDITAFSGLLEEKPEWSEVPSHSDPDLHSALNAQAKALANRTTLLREKCTLTVHAEDFRKDSGGNARSDADTLIAALDFVVSQSNMLLPYEGELSNGIAIDLGGRKYACHKTVKQTGGLKYGQVVFSNGCITWAPPLAAQAKVIEIGQSSGYVYQANFENVTFLQCKLNYRSALSSWVHGSCTFINCVDPISVDDGCHEIYVNSNLFRLTADVGGKKGIVLPADCRADGNVFVGYDIAIHLTQPSNIISGNHFYGCRVGVKEDYSAGQNQIVFNQFDGCTLETDNSCGMGIVSHNIFYAQQVYYAILVNPKPGFTSHVSSRITNNTFNFYNTPDLTPKVGGNVTINGNTITASGFSFTAKMVGAAVFTTDANGTYTNLGVIISYVNPTTATISKVRGFADGVLSVGVQPNAVCYHTPTLPAPTYIPEFVVQDNNINNGVVINTGMLLGRDLYYNPALDNFQLNGKGLESNSYKAFKSTNVSAFAQYANSPDDMAFRAATVDGTGTWAALGYDPTDNGGDGCFVLRGGKAGNGGRYRGNILGFTPGNDNARTLGSATNRWSAVYAATGTINTSDVREKEIATEIEDRVLDAWNDVRLIQYKWKSAIEDKGDDARIHFGVGAQEVHAAFEQHGLDPFAYGLLCYDEWEASTAVYDTEGKEVTPARKAGNRWGVRADECAFLEMALQRRNHKRLLDRLEVLGA